MKSSCISHPENEPLIIIRKWQVEFCQSIGMSKSLATVGAALLSYFEYWHNIKLEMLSKSRAINDVANAHGDERVQDETLLQFHTMIEMEDSLLGIAAQNTIRTVRSKLFAAGVITESSNPNPKYSFDKTIFYQFQPQILTDYLRYLKKGESSSKKGESSSKKGESSSKKGEPYKEIPSETTTEYSCSEPEKEVKMGGRASPLNASVSTVEYSGGFSKAQQAGRGRDKTLEKHITAVLSWKSMSRYVERFGKGQVKAMAVLHCQESGFEFASRSGLSVYLSNYFDSVIAEREAVNFPSELQAKIDKCLELTYKKPYEWKKPRPFEVKKLADMLEDGLRYFEFMGLLDLCHNKGEKFQNINYMFHDSFYNENIDEAKKFCWRVEADIKSK